MPIVILTQPINIVLAALFAKLLFLPNQTIGIISALPFLCNFLQIGITPLLARRFPAKTITLLATTLHLFSWVAFCFMLNVLPSDDPATAGLWTGLWFFCSSFVASITGVSWNAWVQEWVPARLRGKYFGRRNRLLQFSTLSFLLLAGWVLATFEYSRFSFQFIVAFAVALRLLSLLWQIRMPTESRARSTPQNATFAEQLKTVRLDQPFLRFIAFGAVWSFAANLFGPFYHVFMIKELNLSSLSVGLLSVCSASGAALTLPGWGRLLDRFGNKAVMTVSLALWQAGNLGWCFLTPDNANGLYLIWICGGATSAGFFLGQFTLLLKLLPVSARNLALGLNLAITSLFAAIAPIIGGAILDFFMARHAVLPVYHASFVAQPAIAILSGWLLLSIREPAASSLTSVVGAMSNVRALASLSGLSFLSQYIFYRSAKSPRIGEPK